jgi:tripartite-type tricarboxylate transporter receptor subunit TctC
MKKLCAMIAAICLVALAKPVTAATNEPATSRVINIYLPTAPGGAWDVFARVLANHLGAHIPGNPTIVVQFMPGAGGVRVLSHLYNTAPKDGSAMAMALPTALLTSLLEPERTLFKPTEFNWVGSMGRIQDVIYVWHQSPVKTIDDATKTEIPLGATGTGSNTYFDLVMSNNLLGTKFKPILGYQGAAPINLAIERGELHGRAGTWDDLVTNNSRWLSEKLVRPLVQIGQSKLPEIGDVPLFSDLVHDPAKTNIAKFLSVGITLGRLVHLPPGVPGNQVNALRNAFAATMRDPAFLKEAALRKIDVSNWSSGEELQALVADTFSQPAELVASARAILKAR